MSLNFKISLEAFVHVAAAVGEMKGKVFVSQECPDERRSLVAV
jgi:hypothetical protein